MSVPRITWIRAGDRYPDLKHGLDNFIALGGEAEIGLVKWVEIGRVGRSGRVGLLAGRMMTGGARPAPPPE